MALLDEEQIEAGLAQLDGWERDGDAIAKEFDYDVERLGHAMQERQAKGNRPLVRLPARRCPGATASARS